MTCLVAIVADDLTGALDIAAPFAARGLRTSVIVDLERPPTRWSPTDVVVINTASRELSAVAASQRVTEAMKMVSLYEPVRVVKKVDSRLKGHVNVEVRSMLRTLDWAKVIVCPAAPRLGRLVRNGMVVGNGVIEPISVLNRLDLPPDIIDVCDAESDADLLAIASRLRTGVLGVGAHGLGRALAELLAPEGSGSTVPASGRLCFIVASQDPITSAQVDLLRRRQTPNEVEFRDGRLAHVMDGASSIKLFRCVPERSEAMSLDLLAHFTDAIVSSQVIDPYSTILACGGETAQALLKRLGVSELEVLGEYDDGVPISTALTAEGRALKLLTKSGGYGSKTVLADIASWAHDGSLTTSIGTAGYSAGKHVDGKQK